MKKRINISSLGCRLNQSEIQSVITELQERGHHIDDKNNADIYIINACAVTLHSERKTRKLVYQALKKLHPSQESMIIVTGCIGDELIIDDSVFYVPNDYKYLIPDIIDTPALAKNFNQQQASRFSYTKPLKATTTRVNLKIQDGCDNMCSYCIIPFKRGPSQSKDFNAVQEEFKSLIDCGYKEIILTGVTIGNYSSNGKGLSDLIEKLITIEGTYRIHLPSISAHSVDEKLVDLLSDNALVNHINLSLQSGSNSILKKMNRGYTAEEYLTLIKKIKSNIPLFNITTDIIVGFPGETEHDFRQTVELIEEAAFSHIHTFRYSPRPGTAAAQMPDSVSEITKSDRSKTIITLYKKLKEEYYKKFDNSTSILLTEKSKAGKTGGFNEYYIPIELDCEVDRNQFLPVKVRYSKNVGKLRASLTDASLPLSKKF